MYGAEEEDYDEIPKEVSRLLEREENAIQPYKEPLEVINLGSEEDPKEVKIGALLNPDVKSRLIELLKEYVDIFACCTPKFALSFLKAFSHKNFQKLKICTNTKQTKRQNK